MVGSIFLHLAVEASSADIRRAAISSMNAQASQLPEVTNRIASTSLQAYLTKESVATKTLTTSEDAETKAVSKDSRLCAFLISCAAVGANVEQSVRETLVLDLIVVSHHPTLGM
jgi:hypothetical protein